jgi:hypothetical protein
MSSATSSAVPFLQNAFPDIFSNVDVTDPSQLANAEKEIANTEVLVANSEKELGNELMQKRNSLQEAANTLNQTQTNVQNILQDETDRLLARQESINQALDTQNRVIMFNQNFSKRYYEYLQIILTICIGLGVILFYKILQRFLPIQIPDFVGMLVYIGAISFIAIKSIMIYNTISSRDVSDFDKLNITPSPTSPSTSYSTSPNIPQSLMDTQIHSQNSQAPIMCLGGSCCGPNSYWNSITKQCIGNSAIDLTAPGNKEGFEGYSERGHYDFYMKNKK